MTTNNLNIREFIDRLTARLDFRKFGPGDGDYEWLCGRAGDRFFYTKQVLTEMGHEPDAALARLRAGRTIHCDCEIVFNLSDE